MNTQQVNGTEDGGGENEEERVKGYGQQEEKEEEEEVYPPHEEEEEEEVPGGSSSSLDAYLDNPPDIKLWPEARQNCTRCGKRSRLYCPDCLLFVGTPAGVKTPPTELRLPLEASAILKAG